jgi:MFS family permease
LLIVLLCLMVGADTVCLGAFPALLPELGAAHGLADWQLGAVAGAFGFARTLADAPVGLVITHHLSRALWLVPVCLLGGALLLASDGGFATLLLGRAVMGAGYTLGTLSALTAVLRQRAGSGLASSLAALELSAMLGILGGATLIGVLPRAVPWNVALLIACVPVVPTLALLPALRRRLPAAAGARPLFATSEGAPTPRAGRLPLVGVLAAVAGALVAVHYATIEQFLVPIRASRELGLDRAGIARLLMLGQGVDIVLLLPLGALADRRGAPRVLGGVLLTGALAMGLLAFGDLGAMIVGCALYGLGMAGWPLPLGVLRAVTPPERIAWRVALYRVAVDAGMCVGPLLAGLLSARTPHALPAALIAALTLTGVTLFVATSRGGTATR